MPRAIGAGLAVLAVVATLAGILDVAADRRTAAAARLAEASFTDPSVAASDALAAADAAITLRPDSIRYRFRAALAAATEPSEEGMRTALERIAGALRISPGDPILRQTEAALTLQLAQLLRSREELVRAIALWEALVEGDGFHAEYRRQLGNAYALAGELDAAAGQLIAAAALAPRSTSALVGLARVYAAAERIDEARVVLAQIAAIDPDLPELPQLRQLLGE